MEALRVILLRKKLDRTDIETGTDAVEAEKDIPQLAIVSIFRKNTG
jgi:hypothetical protein